MQRTLLARVLACAALACSGDSALSQDGDGQRVHRCVGAHGEIAFSGLPCGADGRSGTGTDATATPPEPPPADSCPASPSQLRDRLAAAIARHDANAVAGMIRWHGLGGEAANQRLRELRELVRHPLLALDPGDVLTVRTGSGATGGVRSLAFGIDAEGGCYWLRW